MTDTIEISILASVKKVIPIINNYFYCLMNHPCTFYEYMQEYLEKLDEHAESYYFDEKVHSNLIERAQEAELILAKISPQKGEPFRFFLWYYKEGCSLYKEHFTSSEDIYIFFNHELTEVRKIFDDSFYNTLDKEAFVKSYSVHFNRLVKELKLDNIYSSECSDQVKTTSVGLYYQIFPMLKKHLEELLTNYQIQIPNYDYPTDENINYNPNDDLVSFLFISTDKYTLPEKLFQLLSNNGFIENDLTTKNKFKAAFNGSRIRDQGKIKWLHYKKKHGPFTVLYFFIQTLIESKGLVAPSLPGLKNKNVILTTRIAKLFCSQDGDTIIIPSESALIQANNRRALKKFTSLETELLSILSTLS